MSSDHAKAYPFFRPNHSYLFDGEGWRRLDQLPPHDDRIPVIASGSNASPDRLVEKYSGHQTLLDLPIYVEQATLADFESVYCAQLAGYGSVPATLAHRAGVQSGVFITWLLPDQLERMHETESVGVNYSFEELSGLELRGDLGSMLSQAYAYISARGAFNIAGECIALNAMSQTEILSHLHQTIGDPNDTLDAFILGHINDDNIRQQRSKLMSVNALKFVYEKTKTIR